MNFCSVLDLFFWEKTRNRSLLFLRDNVGFDLFCCIFVGLLIFFCSWNFWGSVFILRSWILLNFFNCFNKTIFVFIGPAKKKGLKYFPLQYLKMYYLVTVRLSLIRILPAGFSADFSTIAPSIGSGIESGSGVISRSNLINFASGSSYSSSSVNLFVFNHSSKIHIVIHIKLSRNNYKNIILIKTVCNYIQCTSLFVYVFFNRSNWEFYICNCRTNKLFN